jgi:phage baseplate assembly protein W
MADAFGTDLALVPNLVAYDASEVDLSTRPRPLGPHLRTQLEQLTEHDITAREAFDLEVIDGRRNVAHALLLRLLTPRGSLEELGHASYGSRLYELIGERKTDALRNLCRAYVLEVVAQEPRVEPSAVALDFELDAETASSFAFTLAVRPTGGAPLDLSLEVGL